MRFFPRGLNPFKIQRKFKYQKIVEFVFQNMLQFGSFTKDKSYSP
jgi:hypothetical protein